MGKLKTAKKLCLAAFIIMLVLFVMLALVIILNSPKVPTKAFTAYVEVCVFAWLCLAPVVLGLSIAGWVLSAKARKEDAPGAGGVLAKCILVAAAIVLGFLAYGAIIGGTVGA